MILKTNTLGGTETIVSEAPTLQLVQSAITSMDWQVFTFVTLVVDDDNWLDGSGFMNPTDGLSGMLSLDRIQYVCESAPAQPQEFFPYFEAYLHSNWDDLFALIYGAKLNGLSSVQIEDRRREDELPQRKRLLDETLASTSSLFAEKRYAEYIAALTPFELLLPPLHLKKLELARRRQMESSG